METFSIWHILMVMAVMLLLVGGGGKISDLMGDVAKGIKSFRNGLSDAEDEASPARAMASTRHDDTGV